MSKCFCPPLDLNAAKINLAAALAKIDALYNRVAAGGSPVTTQEVIDVGYFNSVSQLTSGPLPGYTPGPIPPPTFQVSAYGLDSSASYNATFLNALAGSLPGTTSEQSARFLAIIPYGCNIGSFSARGEIKDAQGNLLTAVNASGVVFIPNGGKTTPIFRNLILNAQANSILPE